MAQMLVPQLVLRMVQLLVLGLLFLANMLAHKLAKLMDLLTEIKSVEAYSSPVGRWVQELEQRLEKRKERMLALVLLFQASKLDKLLAERLAGIQVTGMDLEWLFQASKLVRMSVLQ